jgi:hypothetical protein
MNSSQRMSIRPLEPSKLSRVHHQHTKMLRTLKLVVEFGEIVPRQTQTQCQDKSVVGTLPTSELQKL